MLALVTLVTLLLLGTLTLRTIHRIMVETSSVVTALPTTSGHVPAQHALSRFHPRWYAASVVFLAFDVEMLFMYPWAVVVADLGYGAVVEMFVFLGILLAAVAWARREGAFRWA